MWLLKKLKKIVKIATAAETLVQGHSAESCFSLANLLNKILYPDPVKKDQLRLNVEQIIIKYNDAVHYSRPVQDTRLSIEIELLREMLNRKELDNTDWIDKTNKIALSRNLKLLNLLQTKPHQY